MIATLGLLIAIGAPGQDAPYKQDVVIYRHEDRYSCFPGVTGGEGDKLWVGFGWNTTRSHYGAAAGGETGHGQFFSPDGGLSWIHSDAEEYEPPPPPNLGFDLGDGIIAMANGRGHETFDEEKAKELEALGYNVTDHHNGNFTSTYRAWTKRSIDGGETWEQTWLDLPPMKYLMPSLGNRRNGLCDDQTMLVPQYGQFPDNTVDCAYVLRSADKGVSWQLIPIADDGLYALNESAVINVGGGRVIAHMRCQPSVPWPHSWDGGFVFQSESADNGATWSEPKRLPMWGYPQTFLRLSDGAILSSYGYRRPPYGIRACFSYDGGLTWDWENEVILRADGLNGDEPKGGPGDLGYPHTVELSDGSLFTVYYFTLGDGVTHIAGSRWSRDYRGPDLARGEDAVPKPDPTLAAERIVGEVRPLRVGPSLIHSFIPTEPTVAGIAIRISEKSSEIRQDAGLRMVVRKVEGSAWWTEWLASTDIIPPADLTIGGWNYFRFAAPLDVTPGDLYAFTIYNGDYTGGANPELREGLEGEYGWYVNSGPPGPDDYPNGGIGPQSGQDIAFKVYAEDGPLPEDP